MSEILEILAPGGGATLQDRGRFGWKRYGVPRGGAMDGASARQANLLVGNEEDAAVVEFLFTGARLRALAEAEIALTGADVEGGHPRWRSVILRAGEEIAFRECRSGVWSYLAVRGGFDAPRWFGSASVYLQAGLGAGLQAGQRLSKKDVREATAVAARFLPQDLLPRWSEAPVLSAYRGPEWDLFPSETQASFSVQAWTISQRSNRTGYRLEGNPLRASETQILSSPLSVGTIQVPPGGEPIVILRDGPTVGGYPRLAILRPDEVSRFTQCAPGTQMRFKLIG